MHGTRTHNPRYLCRLQQILGNGQTEQNVFFHVIRQREAGDFADPMPHGTADGAASQVLQGRHETGTPSVLILLFLPLLAVTAPGVGQGQAHGVLKLGLPVQDLLEGREVGEGGAPTGNSFPRESLPRMKRLAAFARVVLSSHKAQVV